MRTGHVTETAGPHAQHTDLYVSNGGHNYADTANQMFFNGKILQAKPKICDQYLFFRGSTSPVGVFRRERVLHFASE